MIPHIRDNYKYCPHCPGFTESNYEHQFWTCPHSRKLWKVLDTYIQGMGYDMPIKCFTDLISTITRDSNKSLKAVFINELVYNLFYAIWCVYTDSMAIVNSSHDHLIIDRVKDLHKITVNRCNSYYKRSSVMVPVHDKSIKDMDYAEYGLEAKSQGGLLARLH